MSEVKVKVIHDENCPKWMACDIIRGSDGKDYGYCFAKKAREERLKLNVESYQFLDEQKLIDDAVGELNVSKFENVEDAKNCAYKWLDRIHSHCEYYDYDNKLSVPRMTAKLYITGLSRFGTTFGLFTSREINPVTGYYRPTCDYVETGDIMTPNSYFIAAFFKEMNNKIK